MTTHIDVVGISSIPQPNLPLFPLLSLSSLCVWRNLFQVQTKAIKALSSLLTYNVLVSRHAKSYLFSVQLVHYFFFIFLNLFCRMGKLRMDCRTRVVPPLSCISKKLWIWTFLTYLQSHLADIPCGFVLSLPTPKSYLADIPPDRLINCGYGLSSPNLKAI
jgi:hypothetical protein